MVILTPWLLHPWRRNPWYIFNERIGGYLRHWFAVEIKMIHCYRPLRLI
jgi:hypothetical protein